jgi:hypothetical protein
MNEGCASEIIELLGLGADHLRVHRFQEQQMLLQRGGNPATAQRFDKTDEHGAAFSATVGATPPSAWLTSL